MTRIALALLLALSLAQADNYLQVPKSAPKLNPLDAQLKNFSQTQSSNTAYFVDGRTGQILSISKAPNASQIGRKGGNPASKASGKAPSAPKIPYEMKEERIELLR
ncbi:MAG: hypothetical protein AB7U80_03070 [Wolinella sp.]